MSEDILNLLAEANKLREHRNYREAITPYMQAIQAHEENSGIASVIASCYFALAMSEHGTTQDGEQAISWLEKAISIAPNASLYARLGDYYWLVKFDYERALQAYHRSIEIDPCNVKSMAGIAALYDVPEKAVTLEEAIQWLSRAIQLDADNPHYYFRLGYLYLQAGRLTEAQEIWVKSLSCSKPLSSGAARFIQEHSYEGET